MNPYVIIVALIGAIALVSGAYFNGRADGNANGDAKIAAMVEESRKAREAEATAAFKKAEKLEVESAKAKIVYRTITKTVDRIVDRPVYLNQCFDDDGVRAVTDAINGTLAPPAKPDSTLSTTDPAR